MSAHAMLGTRSIAKVTANAQRAKAASTFTGSLFMASTYPFSGAFPLHALHYLPGLRPELVELSGRAAKVDDHRFALRILQDGESVLVSLLNGLVPSVEDRELHAVKTA